MDIGENTKFNGRLFKENVNVDYNWVDHGTQWTFNVGSGTSSEDSMDVFISLYNATSSAMVGTDFEFSENTYAYWLGDSTFRNILNNIWIDLSEIYIKIIFN